MWRQQLHMHALQPQMQQMLPFERLSQHRILLLMQREKKVRNLAGFDLIW
uniref:Uncharacterized protein MANES_18G049000 n=1 Tax=Rhizophora mucronata TaxID=61149 RepID=A0A2P2KLR7_RHIMU